MRYGRRGWERKAKTERTRKGKERKGKEEVIYGRLMIRPRSTTFTGEKFKLKMSNFKDFLQNFGPSVRGPLERKTMFYLR